MSERAQFYDGFAVMGTDWGDTNVIGYYRYILGL